jgi:hypothetical protein
MATLVRSIALPPGVGDGTDVDFDPGRKGIILPSRIGLSQEKGPITSPGRSSRHSERGSLTVAGLTPMRMGKEETLLSLVQSGIELNSSLAYTEISGLAYEAGDSTLSVMQCGLTHWEVSNDFGLRRICRRAQGHGIFAARAPTYGRRLGPTFSARRPG